MCQAMFEAQVMSELQILEIEKDTYIGCVYCGEPKGDWLSCCGENHFDEMEEQCTIPTLAYITFQELIRVSQHLYTVSEIAEQMGKSERWVRQLCIKGKLNAVKMGWAWVILEAWK